MLTNSSLTLYHKRYDKEARLEIWERHNYDKVWWFGGKGAGINKGYADANDVNVRISYEYELDINDFAIGDIMVKGHLEKDIKQQRDLQGEELYNITSINDDKFGITPHIHLGGK